MRNILIDERTSMVKGNLSLFGWKGGRYGCLVRRARKGVMGCTGKQGRLKKQKKKCEDWKEDVAVAACSFSTFPTVHIQGGL